MKIARIVTAPEAVEYHLRNTLDLFDHEYELEIIGDNVSQFASRWPKVKFTDIEIVRKTSFIRDAIALIKLTKLFWKRRFDITHSIMPKAGLLNALAGILTRTPVRIHTFTGQVWKNFPPMQRLFFKTIDRVIVGLCTHCYTDSKSQSQFLYTHGIHKNKSPLPFLGQGSLCGVNTERFDLTNLMAERESFRKKMGADQNTTVFIFLGRKCKDKGTLDLLFAFKELVNVNKNAILLLVGPEDDTEFKHFFYSQFSHIRSIFNLSSTTSPESFIAAADVFCIPSYREGFGSVVIEAGSMGIPSIGTAIPGLMDAIIDKVTGVLVPVGDLHSLTATLGMATTDRQKFKKMGLNAKKRVLKEFNMRYLFELLNKEYARLLREAR